MKTLILIVLTLVNLSAFDSFITPCSLQSIIKNKDTLILDVSKIDLYNKSHIDGAVHADVEKFVTKDNYIISMKQSNDVQTELQSLGVNKDSRIIIYSHNTNKGLTSSSFLSLVLISHGFNNVSILDGGYMAWVYEYPLLCEIQPNQPKYVGNFRVSKKADIFVDSNYVKNSIGKVKIIDSRSSGDYFATKRSVNVSRTGHIPSAKSSFYKDKFLTDGTIRFDDELTDIFTNAMELKKDEEIIVYGNTLMDASMNWFILYKTLGFKNTKIYENSLIEWGNDLNLPMTKFKWE